MFFGTRGYCRLEWGIRSLASAGSLPRARPNAKSLVGAKRRVVDCYTLMVFPLAEKRTP
jgi:hypothetical protein